MFQLKYKQKSYKTNTNLPVYKTNKKLLKKHAKCSVYESWIKELKKNIILSKKESPKMQNICKVGTINTRKLGFLNVDKAQKSF